MTTARQIIESNFSNGWTRERFATLSDTDVVDEMIKHGAIDDCDETNGARYMEYVRAVREVRAEWRA